MKIADGRVVSPSSPAMIEMCKRLEESSNTIHFLASLASFFFAAPLPDAALLSNSAFFSFFPAFAFFMSFFEMLMLP